MSLVKTDLICSYPLFVLFFIFSNSDRQISEAFNEDIGFCIVNFGAQWETLPLRTFQSTLSLFSVLVTVCGSSMRHIIENFFRQVYMKALLKYIEVLDAQVSRLYREIL